jgi:hypothetical protein
MNCEIMPLLFAVNAFLKVNIMLLGSATFSCLELIFPPLVRAKQYLHPIAQPAYVSNLKGKPQKLN